MERKRIFLCIFGERVKKKINLFFTEGTESREVRIFAAAYWNINTNIS